MTNRGGSSLHAAVIGGGFGALGSAAQAKIRAERAKHLTTPEGHAKAIAKRDAWKKEMKSAFAGTSYANLPPYAKKRKNHKRV
jgi:hypothetical protein